MAGKSLNKWQFGDFQTPAELANKVVRVLKQNHKLNPDVIIEPTCGKGAFVLASCNEFKSSRILGFDINPNYKDKTQGAFGVQELNMIVQKLWSWNRSMVAIKMAWTSSSSVKMIIYTHF